MENQIVIYQTDNGQTAIDVRLENDTVWLTQAQMAELFQSDRTTIVRHINNIYKDEELEREATCAKIAQVQTEGKRQVTRTIPYYNLDLIISVGYRVNSKRGIKFRQWANKVLKDYLLKGYAVNEKIRRNQIGELRQLVQMVGRTLQNQSLLNNDENQALFDIVVDYTYALDTLDDYDYQRLGVKETTQEEKFQATYDNAMQAVSRHQKPFVQRRQQTHCRNAVPVVPQQQRHPLSRGRQQTYCRQHLSRTDLDDCREQARGKRCDGEGGGELD